jgi:hypothetical protein
MKKIKWSIMTLTIVFAITAAFTTRPHFNCLDYQQYYLSGTNYIPVSSCYGCTSGSQFCTYYSTNGGITFAGCTIGTYNGIMFCAVEDPKTKPAANSANSAGSKH